MCSSDLCSRFMMATSTSGTLTPFSARKIRTRRGFGAGIAALYSFKGIPPIFASGWPADGPLASATPRQVAWVSAGANVFAQGEGCFMKRAVLALLAAACATLPAHAQAFNANGKSLRQIYEYLHRNPELSFQERNTSTILAAEMK